VKVDAFDDSSSSTPGSAESSWQNVGGDWQLVLKKNAGGIAAGARVYGVEGLDVSQLGKLALTVESGPCGSIGPMFALYFDANRDGTPDGSRNFTCNTGGGGASKSWDPVALGVPGTAIVTSLDILHGADNSTAVVDDIGVAGLFAGDTNVVRAV
jgi:hypothetical protein